MYACVYLRIMKPCQGFSTSVLFIITSPDVIACMMTFTVLCPYSYTVCIGRVEDRKFFRKLRLKTLVLDEGHMLKNMSTLKYNYLMRMQVVQLYMN